ncbi:aminotransferase-like domain-containing protein [Pedobacter chitinilyticus]|uniref:PLP-dependent aminotransferase family protein n=1 Tax=Pedobacter chitinilyticus TaxID=2233776 RepID=A0A3S3PYX2_9SPHI|nr:PLP-dependent aminotransferase family protein [Pedobacter chitinilyticus]RWU07467.1 PLP-dependent aminotransferase family protein [Pedobacter chitinilyticus]
MKKDFIYNEIADNIASKIKTGVLQAGERLASVRILSREHGISINTAKRVFLELEAQSLVQSRPQSGYFVSPLPYLKLPLPQASQPLPTANITEPNELIDSVYSNMGNKELTLLSIGVPSGNLLPLAKLKKEVVLATRALKEGGTEYEPLQGNVKLRRMIAARSLAWEGHLKESDVVTTAGCMNALTLCLMALTKPGDTVAMESPCYPGILQLALSLRLKVLEVATDPVKGVNLDALKALLPQINVCLLVPNFNTPLGYCMPDDQKKAVVMLLEKHDIPLIEDDTYGDLYFGTERPKCCKSFDTKGNVLYCGSVSKTLAPGYRVGWVAPGKYKEQIMRLKMIHALSSTSVINEAVGNFLMTGRYENHLRHLRKTLQENYQRYALAIAEFFPVGTKISRPQGGLALWVEFPEGIDTATLYNYAMKKQISIAPGRMFTLQEQFHNCMRLCIGLPWTDDLRLTLKQIGNLAKWMVAKA